MKIEKAHHVLQALHTDRIDTLTKEALVTAFNDDGIFDLEGTAEYILKRMKKDKEVQKTELKLTDFTSFSELTSEKARRSIIHRAPEVSFILDGIEYDPKDISNFDGQALIFAPIIEPDGSMRLQVFHEEIRSVLAGYFQMQQIITLINPTNYDFPIPGVPPPVTIRDPIPPPPPPPYTCRGFPSWIPCEQIPPPPPPAPHQHPNAPVTWDEVQMFEHADYAGDWFWLSKGHVWNDLTRISRGGIFGGDWNDKISSLSSTNTACLYGEHINVKGSILFLTKYKPISHLSELGWNDRISSVWNYGNI